MAEVVFEGDQEYTRGATRGGVSRVVARSSVADFLLRRHIVTSERQARWFAGLIAAIAVGLVAASASWAAKAVGAAPTALPYGQLTAAERALLPAQHRLYLERLKREADDAKERAIRERFRSGDTRK